jgi:hypothetical protein
MISRLQGCQRRGLGLLAEFRHPDPHVALAGRDPHPARRAGPERPGQATERPVQIGSELVDERGRVQGLADRGVVDLAVRFEALGQVCVGVAPATRALYPDLAAADSVAQAGQNAQLVRDPLHAPALVHDRRAPLRSHHAIEGNAVGRVVVDHPFAMRVAAQQLKRLHQRPVRGVVAPELERLKYGWEHPAVVVAVGGAQHLAHLRLERPIVRLRLTHQLPQRLLPNDRKDRAADRVVGMLDRGASEREQDPALAAHRFEIGD